MLSSASDKVKLFAENFSKNTNLDDSLISLPVFLLLRNISLTSKMFKKVIMNLDLSKATVSLLSMVSKVFEKLNRIVYHLKKYGLFSDFLYGFRSFRSTADLTVLSDRIARAFNRSGATQAVAFDISKAFYSV